MNKYELIYEQPTFVRAKRGGGAIQYSQEIFCFESETDEEAVLRAKTFLETPVIKDPSELSWMTHKDNRLNKPINLLRVLVVEWKL